MTESDRVQPSAPRVTESDRVQPSAPGVTESGRYTFGDSGAAAERLELLATAFGPATERFLRARGPVGRGLAVDLGCGPGHTTALLAATLSARRTLAVERSPAFVAAARDRLAGRATVIEGDVTDLPAAVDGIEVGFARFLLTHLADPLAAVAHWRSRLAEGGVLLLQEVESIETDVPALAAYLARQRTMLAAHGHTLEIGPALGGGEVVTVRPAAVVAARMFALNFMIWGEREVSDAHERARIAADLAEVDSGTITWQLRELVVRADGA